MPAASNKISAVGGTSYSYDSAGNITAIGAQSYIWNAAGQMKEAKVGGTTVGTYTYDSQNRRTKKVAGGVTTYYVYGAGGLLYGEYTSAGALVREYVYLNGQPLAQVDAGSPEVLTYIHTDHLGTPRFGTNTAGTQLWAWTSDAFGVGAPSGSRTVNLRMPGQYFDSESGLFYNWNRYYNPAIGRYISSDPIGLEGGLNTFNYVEANPVMYTDPEGLSPSSAVAKKAARGIGLPAWCNDIIDVLDPWNIPSLCEGDPVCECEYNGVCPVSPSTPDEETAVNPEEKPAKTQEKICQELKESVLATCASLTGRKKFDCFAAAQATYDACME